MDVTHPHVPESPQDSLAEIFRDFNESPMPSYHDAQGAIGQAYHTDTDHDEGVGAFFVGVATVVGMLPQPSFQLAVPPPPPPPPQQRQFGSLRPGNAVDIGLQLQDFNTEIQQWRMDPQAQSGPGAVAASTCRARTSTPPGPSPPGPAPSSALPRWTKPLTSRPVAASRRAALRQWRWTGRPVPTSWVHTTPVRSVHLYYVCTKVRALEEGEDPSEVEKEAKDAVFKGEVLVDPETKCLCLFRTRLKTNQVVCFYDVGELTGACGGASAAGRPGGGEGNLASTSAAAPDSDPQEEPQPYQVRQAQAAAAPLSREQTHTELLLLASRAARRAWRSCGTWCGGCRGRSWSVRGTVTGCMSCTGWQRHVSCCGRFWDRQRPQQRASGGRAGRQLAQQRRAVQGHQRTAWALPGARFRSPRRGRRRIGWRWSRPSCWC